MANIQSTLQIDSDTIELFQSGIDRYALMNGRVFDARSDILLLDRAVPIEGHCIKKDLTRTTNLGDFEKNNDY